MIVSPIEAAKDTVIMKDSKERLIVIINKQFKSRQYNKQPPKNRLFQVAV